MPSPDGDTIVDDTSGDVKILVSGCSCGDIHLTKSVICQNTGIK
jgi:hypothetical protein